MPAPPASEKVKVSLALKSANFSGNNASIGFEIRRDALPLPAADALLVGARLDVTLSVGDPAQRKLFEVGDEDRDRPVEGVADVHRLSVGAETITGRLSFRNCASAGRLPSLTNKEVVAVFERTGDAGGSADDEEEGEADPQAAAAPKAKAAPKAPPAPAVSTYARGRLADASADDLTRWHNEAATGALPGEELHAIRAELARRSKAGKAKKGGALLPSPNVMPMQVG